MRRLASQVIRNLETRIARLEKQSRRRLHTNNIDDDFYDGFVEEVEDSFERDDGVTFVLIEVDDGSYSILRSEDGTYGWERFSDFRSLSRAESSFKDIVEEFSNW